MFYVNICLGRLVAPQPKTLNKRCFAALKCHSRPGKQTKFIGCGDKHGLGCRVGGLGFRVGFKVGGFGIRGLSFTFLLCPLQ